MLKGQIEFLAMIGVVIVALVVVVYTLQGPVAGPFVGDIQQEQKLVKDSILNMIRSGSLQILEDMENHGGYIEGTVGNSVKFNGDDVPYWQYQGNVNIPEIKPAFIQALTQYIEENKQSIVNSLGKEVVLGQAVISNVNFLPNQLNIQVNMPTELIAGDSSYPITQPYSLSVDTKLSEAYDFSKDFVVSASQNRYFEYFTMASITGSELDGDLQETPTLIHLTECGEFVFTNWNEIKPKLEFLIKRTVEHTYMPDKVPLNTGDETSYPKYGLWDYNEGNYAGLDVSFSLPDGFGLSRSTFQLSQDTIWAFAKPIPFTGSCMSDPILVDYMINFPVVVRVKDTFTGNKFQFAIDVFIKDNGPGDFGVGISGYDTTYQAELCQYEDCPVNLKVTTSSGAPVSAASVSFMGCGLGITNSEGMLQSQSPCGVGPLEIYKSGYGPFIEMESSNNINGAEIPISGMIVFTVHFHEVNVNKLPSGAYQITPQGVREINDLHKNQAVSIGLQSSANSVLCDNGLCQWYFESRAGLINHIPAGFYSVSAALLDSNTPAGMIITPFTIEEDLDGGVLHMYIPYYLPFKSIESVTEQVNEAEKLTRFLKSCGVGPLTEVPVELEVSCIKNEGEF